MLAICRLAILRRHHGLTTVSLPMQHDDKRVITSWLATQVAVFGAELPIQQLSPEDWANQQRPRGAK